MNVEQSATDTTARPAQVHRPWTSLSWRTLMLAVAAVLPMLVLAGVLVVQAATNAQAHADGLVRDRVSRLTRDATAAMDRARNALDFLASRPEVNEADVPACQRLVRRLTDIDRLWANLAVLGTDGRLLCAAKMPAAGTNVTMADRPWFQQALADGNFVIGQPVRAGPVLGRPVLPIARGLRNRQGHAVGVVLLALDLVALSKWLGDADLPAGSAFILQLGTGHIVAHYPDAEKWVGTNAGAKLTQFERDHPSGLGLDVGLDGVQRVYALSRLDMLGWKAVVGVPQEQVFTAARDASRNALLGVVASLVVGGVVAVALARRISRPLEALARTADAVAGGQVHARAPELPTGEISTVARQFNLMLDRQESVEQGLRRANSLYETLARANRAMVRGGTFVDIAREVCGACVESGLATLVAVAVRDGQYARVLVGAGPVASVFTGQFERLDCSAPELAHLPMPTVLRTGEPVICNDYLGLPLVSWVRERAVELNLRAMAVFPLRCDGKIWGGLIFHTASLGWFDEERVQLIGALADDLSYVLDNEAREDARRLAERALRERDHQMAGIVETTMDAVITIDATQRICVFNAAASRIFGIDASQALGQSIEMFIPHAARAAHAEHVQAFARDASAAHRMGRQRQLRGLRADGSEFPIEASIARHQSGDQVLMTVFVRDVSDIRAAEQARSAQLAAEAANQAKSVFLANMSHEIRTPMNAILGFTDLALRTELTPQQAGYLEKSRVAAEGLLGLIDQILDLSKIEAGKLELEQLEFAVDEAVRAVQVVVADRAASKGLAFRVNVDAGVPPRLVGDAPRLTQVLINLAGNAVKFTDHGEVSVEVTCPLQDARVAQLRCTVRDTGIGMTKDEVGRVFQPFTQADASTSRRFGGTGLGLAISRQLVDLMGGRLEVLSEPGKGSAFSFTVPLGCVSEPLAAVNEPADREPAGEAIAPLLRHRTVLLVEDNEFNQVVASEVLRSVAGMTVSLATSGPEALDALERERFDIVLMDVQMPGMDGYETVRRIRAQPRFADLPIVAMTAHASASDRQACLAAGMNDFLSKPFAAPELLRVLAQWLQPKRQ